METFKAHGGIQLTNCFGYLVELSNCGEAARLQGMVDGEIKETTDWLPIEFQEDAETGEYEPVIDPEGYDIPLNMVMRIN